MDKKEQILKAFKNAGRALKAQEISDETGIEKKEVSKLIKVLKTEEKIYSPKNCYYDINK